MTDTPAHIYQKQYEIIAAKPLYERVRLAMDTIDTTRQWIENSIRQANPDISKVDLAVAVFLRYYQHDFTEKQIEPIILSIQAYYAVHK